MVTERRHYEGNAMGLSGDGYQDASSATTGTVVVDIRPDVYKIDATPIGSQVLRMNIGQPLSPKIYFVDITGTASVAYIGNVNGYTAIATTGGVLIMAYKDTIVEVVSGDAIDVAALLVAIQELQPVTINTTAKDAAWILANPTYTIPNKQAGLVITSSVGAASNTVITLPAGAECIGDMCTVIVNNAAGGGTIDTVDIVLGGANATLTDVVNGTYLFACISTGMWARLLIPTVDQSSSSETAFGPGAVVTGDISDWSTNGETAFKALLTACVAAGICSDTTST